MNVVAESMETRVLAVPGGTTSEPATVDVVTSYEGLLALGPDWNDLVAATAIDHPFLGHDWIRTWWECFANGDELRIVMVRRAGELVALAPLMLRRTRMYGIPVRRLRSIGNVYTERFDFVFAPGAEDALGLILSWLGETQRGWDVVQLAQLPETSPLPSALAASAAADGWPVGVWRAPGTPFVPLDGSFEEYIGRRSAKHRSNLRNRLGRLGRLDAVRLETIVHGDISSALDDAFRLEAVAWKATAGTAILSRPAVTRFYTRLAERALARGSFRLHFLTVGGRRIAVEYCLTWGRKLFFLKGGYDPGYSAYSPSNLLFYLVVQDAFRQGLTEIDFLGEPEPWKLEWTGVVREHCWLYLFSPGPLGRLLHGVKFRLGPLAAGLRA